MRTVTLYFGSNVDRTAVSFGAMRITSSPALVFSLVAMSGALLFGACSSSDSGTPTPADGGSGESGGSGDQAGSSGSSNHAGSGNHAGADNAAGSENMAGSGASDNGDSGAPGAGGSVDTEPTLPSTTALSIATGRQHACAVTAEGAVRCWGYSDVGQLGNEAELAEVAFPQPVQVSGIEEGATAVSSSSDHSCALIGGAVKCWGLNDKHQLGGSSTDDSATPVTVAGLTGIKAISAGANHTCALTAAGGVKCWGEGDSGQLGNDGIVDSGAPVDVMGLSTGVTAIAAGRFHSCAVNAAGGVVCWGSNNYGELGNDSTDASHVPVAVSGLASGIVSVAAGDSTTCVITSAGAAKCWGKNAKGQLGNGDSGTQVESHVPVDVTGLTAGVTSITTGYDFTCAVVAGAAKCWGDNFDGTIGNGKGPGYQVATPVAATGLASGVQAIASGAHDVCAIVTGSAVKCWGLGSGGQLGNGSTDDTATPVDVLSLP